MIRGVVRQDLFGHLIRSFLRSKIGVGSEAMTQGNLQRFSSVTVLGLVLILVIPVLLRHIDRGEFNINADEGAHAMTGMYFADLIADHPVTHAVQYTYRYYSQYPGPGLILWLPFFQFVVAHHLHEMIS